MKKIILTAFAALACLSAGAQYTSVSFTKEVSRWADYKIIQIDQVDGHNIIYFERSAKIGSCKSNVEASTCVKIPGQSKPVKIKSVLNYALDSDNVWAYIGKPGEINYYAMVFDEFPLDQPFDILSKYRGVPEYADVTVNLDEKSELIDPEALFEEYPVVYRGEYYDDGTQMAYCSQNGLTVTAHFAYTNDYGRLFQVYFELANDSGRPVDFRTEDITVTHIHNKTGRKTECKVLSFDDFDAKVVSNLGWYSAGSAASSNAGRFATMSQASANRNDTGASIAYGLLSILSSVTAKDGIEQQNRALEEERDRTVKNYLKSNTIPDGGVYGGFIAVKYPSKDDFEIELSIAKSKFHWHVSK